MKKATIVLWLVLLSLSVTMGGARAAEQTALKDLGALEEASLEVLRDVHHRYLVAEIALAGAKSKESAAKEEVDMAKKTKQAEEADLKAATAELKAAKENNDERRSRLAESQVLAAGKDLDKAKAFLKWKEAEVATRKQEIELAKEMVSFRRAEMEMARAELVVRAGIVTEKPYRLDAFRKEVADRDKDVQKATKKVSDQQEKAVKARKDWEQKG